MTPISIVVIASLISIVIYVYITIAKGNVDVFLGVLLLTTLVFYQYQNKRSSTKRRKKLQQKGGAREQELYFKFVIPGTQQVLYVKDTPEAQRVMVELLEDVDDDIGDGTIDEEVLSPMEASHVEVTTPQRAAMTYRLAINDFYRRRNARMQRRKRKAL